MAGHPDSDVGADDGEAYEAPAVETRTAACDPLIMITTSPVVCL
jgi:hypothetical protein